MVSSDPTNDNLATATEESPLPPSTTASATKKKKKPRYSKAKKRELQQQRLLKGQEEQELKKTKRRKRAREKSNGTQKKTKSEAPKDEIDRILQCAEKSLFTDSIVVINKREKITESSQSIQRDEHKRNNENDVTEDTGQSRLIVEMISGCNLSEHDDDIESANSEPLSLPSSSVADMLCAKLICTIKVQPLLVLDLNGILCHRDRKAKRSTFLESIQADPRFHEGTPKTGSHPITHWDLRRPTGNVANTGIIPRTDLLEFLHYLDKHFCLAVWTSAKSKTAKKLLKLLLSPGDGNDATINASHDKYDCKGIRSRLLFVWNQSQCTAVRSTNGSPDEIAAGRPPPSTDEGTGDDPSVKEANDDDEHSFDGDLVFEKHLPKIWETYPLWSASNTLLIDDSPEKCSMAVGNAIHPPPLHGRNPRRNRNQNDSIQSCFLSDQDNEDKQASFFRKLVSFWSDCPHRSRPPWDLKEENVPKDTSSRPIEEDRTSVASTNAAYYQFLQRHAKGYMGWRENKT